MIDLSKLAGINTPDDRLLPAERNTIRLGGKAYFWSRETAWGDLELVPGYVPTDPAGCQGIQTPQLITPGAQTWPRTCVLPRAHATPHLHKPTLTGPGEWWGTPPVRLPNGAIAVPGLGGTNLTFDTPAQQAHALATGNITQTGTP